jgi:type II secretion system protein N
MATLSSGTGPPRWARVFAIAIGGIVLFAVFLFRGFPYDALGEHIASALEPHGVRLQMASLGPAFQLAGPALEASGVRATLSGGQMFEFDRALVRPAWSLAWFALKPALYLEVESPLGAAEGVLELSDSPAWEGELIGLDLKQLPIAALPSARIEGRLDATLDVAIVEGAPQGPAEFEIHDGTLTIPGSPIALPFESLRADMVLGGTAYAEVESIELRGPLASASGGGRIGNAASFARAPLDFDVSLEVKPAFAGAARAAGLRVDPQGASQLQLTGTVSNPKIR